MAGNSHYWLNDCGQSVLLPCKTARNHCRNADKVAATQKSLESEGGSVSSYTCNLASLSQIKQFAEAVKADHNSIDVLINNAGVFESQRSLSEDGFEMTWAVNVLAPFLLTSLLKDIVTQRIVNVSSISASSSIDFDNLQQVMSFLPILMVCSTPLQLTCPPPHTCLASLLEFTREHLL